jgi:hypothetical protein
MLAQVASKTLDVMNFDNLNFLRLYFFFFLTANFATPEGVMSTAEINQIQRIILRMLAQVDFGLITRIVGAVFFQFITHNS